MFGEDLYNTSKKCKVSDVCTALIGLTYKPVNVTESGTIVLRSGNIKNQELYLKDDIVRVSDITIKDEKYIKDKDILMCSRNGSARLVGKSCLIRNPKEKMSFGAFMTVIRTDYPYFMQSFFSSDFFKKQLVGVKTASVNQITTSMLYAYETIRIDKEKEKLFAAFVQQIDKSKFIVKQQIADLQELLDSKIWQARFRAENILCNITAKVWYNKNMSDLEYQNEQTYFLTFCIEQYKHLKNMNGAEVKELFDNKGVSDYLIQNYDVLHTQGREWLLDDIDTFIKNRETAK